MTAPEKQMRLVIVGATGMVGGYALRYALDHPAVGCVTAIGRRARGISHRKLKEILHHDLGDGESFTTLELKINFLKPVWKARLLATGRVVKQGRTVGMVECDVTDEKGSLVARATSTCLTLSRSTS